MASHDVFLLSSNGQKVQIHCTLSDTVKVLRRQACDSLNCEDNCLRIIFCGKEIKDQQTTLAKMGLGLRDSWFIHCSIKPANKKKVPKPVPKPVAVDMSAEHKRLAARARPAAPAVTVPIPRPLPVASASSAPVMVDLTSDDESAAVIAPPATTVASASSSSSVPVPVMLVADSSDEDDVGASTHSRKRPVAQISTGASLSAVGGSNSQDSADDIVFIG